MAEKPNDVLQNHNDHINWFLAHPGASRWLKSALSEARTRDPVELLNDLELLNRLLRPMCETRIRTAFPEDRLTGRSPASARA